ncbi:MAG: 6-hydroxymethylpterin diphosphokinase MptE-like protein [Candidatus Dojkabacteria bacterium]
MLVIDFIKTIAKKTPLVHPLYSNVASYIKYRKDKKILRRNKRYKDMYEGKRCFILGNAPSLKKHNLRLLEDEYVFTVNSMSASKEFDIVKPNFHVVVDSARFDEDNELFHKQMKDLAERDYKPICIFSARFRDHIEKYGLNKSLEIIYVYPKSSIRRIKDINLTEKVPPYQNVVNVALYTALYLGFSEIYLIGCDMTGFITIYDENDNVSYGGHFYEEDNPEEVEYMKKAKKERTNEFMLNAYGFVFRLLRFTEEYAIKNGKRIFNAGIGGALDVFPRVKFEDLFDEQDK